MITANEAALAAGRSLDLVRRWCRTGRVAGATFADGCWFVPVAALDDLRRMPRRPARRLVA